MVGRTGGADLVHAPHEEEDALLGDLHDGEIGARGGAGEEGGVEGTGGGAGRDRLGGVGEEGLGMQHLPRTTPPSQPPPSPPTTPSPRWGSPSWTNPQQRPGPLGGGGGSRCVVLDWWWRCRGSGVHKLKRAPCSPSLESGRAGNPWWQLVATISSMSPLCSRMVSHRASAASPRAVPAYTATW